MKQVYLLTGKPGSGKTSLIKDVVAGLKGKAGGFYTEEIRSGGSRQGFRLVTLSGREAILAHQDIKSPYRVSRYRVDTASLDSVGVAALKQAAGEYPLVIIDEIGKMELFSSAFKEIVSEIISNRRLVLGTIMSSPHPWADALKLKPQVRLITLTKNNQRQVKEEISAWLKANLKVAL